MSRFRITLNFSFLPHELTDCELEDESKEMIKAYKRTEAFYKKNTIEAYVKTFDVGGFVEYLLDEDEIVSAEWDSDKFQIHMYVETSRSKEVILEELKTRSLEDGEYENCSESGWQIFTRGPKGEIYWGESNKQAWEYGVTDYRQNPITIEQLPFSAPLDDDDEGRCYDDDEEDDDDEGMCYDDDDSDEDDEDSVEKNSKN